MKLAEALAERADLEKRIVELRVRLAQSARIQEGDQPPEDVAALLTELAQLLGEQTTLFKRINRTNIATHLDEEYTLMEALAERQLAARHADFLNDLIMHALSQEFRYTRTEIRYVTTLDVPAVRNSIEHLAQRQRHLDTAIQAANWTTDLLL